MKKMHTRKPRTPAEWGKAFEAAAIPSSRFQEIEECVIAKLRTRRDAGRKKYGITMERTDLTRRQWLQHAQEEALDFVVYLEKLIQEEAK